MDFPALDEVLIRLTSVFPFAIEFILAVMALGGLLLIVAGLIGLYGAATDRGRGQMYGVAMRIPWASLGQILLGGALAVPLPVMWDVAGTFVAGGEETYNILSYLPPADDDPYCEAIANGLTLFLMTLGLIAIGWSAVLANDRITSGRQGTTGMTLIYFFGGMACFFITSVAAVLSATFGIEIGFEQVCAVLGT